MHLFEENGVDAVFMGHDHNWSERSIDGVDYITLDSIVNTESSSYVRLDVDGSTLKIHKIVFNQ
jgi:UDP-2,3-diacylglucosamine pyrophosphatase LpxH